MSLRETFVLVFGEIEQDCFQTALDESQCNAATTHRRPGRISTCISDAALQAQMSGYQHAQGNTTEDDSANLAQDEILTAEVQAESASRIGTFAGPRCVINRDAPAHVSGEIATRDVMKAKNVDVTVHSPKKSTAPPLTRTLRNGKTIVLVTPKPKARRNKLCKAELIAEGGSAKACPVLRRRIIQGTKENIEDIYKPVARNPRRGAIKKNTLTRTRK